MSRSRTAAPFVVSPEGFPMSDKSADDERQGDELDDNKLVVGGKSPGTAEDAINAGIKAFKTRAAKTQYQPFKW